MRRAAKIAVGLAVAAGVGWLWVSSLEPIDTVPLAPAPPLAENVGATVTLEARYKGQAPRYMGAPIPGKVAYAVRAGGAGRLIVHSAQPLACDGILTLTGKVLKRNPIGDKPTSYQLDVDHSSCRAATATTSHR